MRKFSATYARANLAKVMKIVDQGEEVIITYRPGKDKAKTLTFKLTMIPGKDDILPSCNYMNVCSKKADKLSV